MVTSANKAYQVFLLGENEPRVIQANEVMEADGRLRFLGPVEGYENISGSRETVASFLSSQVVEYSAIPVPEIDKVGAHKFQINLVEGTTQEVLADKVMYAQGSAQTPGLFTLVTVLNASGTRTEFTASDAQVRSITRLVESGDDVTVPSPAASSDVTASSKF